MPTIIKHILNRFQLHASGAIASCKRALNGDSVVAGHGRPPSITMLEQRIMLSASPIAIEAPEIAATTDADTTVTSLVFVDSSVANGFELANEVKRLGGTDRVQVVFLDSTKGGIEQLDAAISTSKNIESIHIFSHGNGEGIQIGSTWLTAETITPYASSIVSWRDSLTSDADLLFYGCDLASDTSGRELLESIAELTGADVAASDDLTGHEQLGGDWDLEFKVGTVSSELVFSQAFQNQWISLLDTATFQQGVDGYSEAADVFVHELAPNTNFGSSEILVADGGIIDQQSLIKFENIFGSGPNQIPFGSTIDNVSLNFHVVDTGAAGQTITIHAMESEWDESSTWNSVSGSSASSTPDASVDGTATTAQFVGAGMVNTVQGWSNGDTNHGWVIFNSSASNIWQARSSDSTNVSERPQLQIQYTPPSVSPAAVGNTTGLWFSTRDDVSGSGVNGTDSWTDGTVLQLADPNLSLGSGTNSGTFTVPFNLDDFAGGDSEVQGIHYVSRDLTVGGANSIQLQAGDVLLSTNNDETVVGNNTIDVDREDIFAFRPDTVGDYSSGTFFNVFDNIEGSKLHAFTLVEQDTQIGTTDVSAGDVLFSVSGGDHEIVQWFRTTDVGVGTTAGSIETLIDGNDLGFGDQIQGIELLENEITLGGSTFAAGGLIITSNNNITIDGTTFSDNDLVFLDISQDSRGGSTAQANATTFLSGGDVGLDSNDEDIHSFSLVGLASTTNTNTPPTAVNDSYTVDQGGSLSTLGGQWFDNAWASRLEITIDNSSSSTAMVDEPLLVVLDSTNFDYSKAQSAGQDLRFIDANGTLLDFEIEDWNQGGESRIWVQPSQIDAGTSENIWMYFENSDAIDGQNPSDVWSSQYAGVYHLGDNVLDSTNNNNDPTASNTSSSSGQIGSGESFDGDTSFINLGRNSTIDDLFDGGGTISAWVNLNSFGENGFGRILDKANDVVANTGGWNLSVDGPDGQLTFEIAFDGQFGRWRAPAGSISLSNWHHVAVTFDGTASDNPRLFIDGVEVTLTETRTPSGNLASDSGFDLSIGNHLPSENRGFDGQIDEVRLINRSLTQGEIALQFRSTSASLTSLSAIETRTTQTGVLVGDVDLDGDSLTATKSTDPSHGSLTLNPDGSFVYTHDGSNNFTDSFTYQVSDGNGGTDSGTVNIVINAPPSISLSNQTANIAENSSTTASTRVADIVIHDDGLGTNLLSLSGTDAAAFEIVGNELHLRAGVTLDFETQSSYSVLVNVDDPNIGVTPENQASYTLAVTDVNEAPTLSLTNQVSEIPEDSDTSADIRVADIVIDDDALGNNSLVLSGVDAADFVVVGNELRLRAGTNLDASTKTQFNVNVDVSDSSLGGVTDSHGFTLTISNVNLSPTVSLANTVASIRESANTSSGLRIADIVVDDDESGTNTLTLAGADSASFEIIGSELWLRAGTALDFETQQSFEVTVTVTDPTLASSDSTNHTLNIGDVNESPTTSAPTRIDSIEDADGVEFDLSNWFSDVDSADTNLRYSIQNSPASWLEYSITGASKLRIDSAPDANGITQIVVRGTDSENNFVESTIVVNIAPVNDTIGLRDQFVSTDVDTPIQGKVSNATSDADGELLTFTLVASPQNGQVSISPDGQFLFTPNADFTGVDSFQVTANDGVAASTPATINVMIAAAAVPVPSSPTEESRTSKSDESAEENLQTIAQAPSGDKFDDEETGPLLGRQSSMPQNLANSVEQDSSDEYASRSATAEGQAVRNASIAKQSKARPSVSASLVSYTATTKASPTTAEELKALSQPGLMWQQLDQFQHSITTDSTSQKFTIGSVGTASSSLIVGYVIWALRSGVLMSSMMAAMPAWNLLDPLAIVSVADNGNGDGESLEDIVESQKQKLNEPT